MGSKVTIERCPGCDTVLWQDRKETEGEGHEVIERNARQLCTRCERELRERGRAR